MIVDSKLLLDDERARQAALDVSRSFIVQAPAGSGKTELLIQRYLRLLAAVSDPEEVLAITFTRKAAAEMAVRVIDALRRAGSGIEPEQAHERVTQAAAREVLERDRQSGWNILDNPRRLRIQTLDSLNATIARTQPLTSSSGTAGSSIIADAEMRALYRTAAALTFDQLGESDAFAAATATVLRHVDNHTGRYIDYLARMLATRDQWLPFIGSGSVDDTESRRLRSYIEHGLELVVSAHLEETLAAVSPALLATLRRLGGYAARNLLATKPEDSVCALADPEALTRAGTASIGEWLGLADLLLTGTDSWRRQLNRNQGFPPKDEGQKAEMTELLDMLQDNEQLRVQLSGVRTLPPQRYSDEQWRVLLALFRLLPLTVTELRRLFAERGVTDHIEVALCAAAALGSAEEPGDIALLLDYQLRHVLVDEMQDTSTAQYRMIEALTGGWQAGDGRTLFCVGDPMQSIYRFRNAEVGQFLLAQESGIGTVELQRLTLRRNFRSGAGLVEWFNSVFPDVLAPEDDPRQSAVAYAEASPVAALAGRGRVAVHPVVGGAPGHEADLACELIERLLGDNPGDDLAVLVRSRTQLPPLLARLRKAGIDYHAVEIDRLTDLPEVVDVLALTRALVHCGDRLAWLAILRAPWLGLDWTDLHTLVGNDRRSTVWELLNDSQVASGLSEYARQNLPAFVERMAEFLHRGRAESLRDRVEQAWLRLGGPGVLDEPQDVINVYRYLDVIDKIEVAGSLHDVAELESALDVEHVSSEKNARLQIMTMHRAKGLQFDHVLLYGLGHVPRAPDQEVLSWLEIPGAHGESQMIISPVGPRADVEKDPVHRHIAIMAAAKNRNELGRLLYVACTRARKSLQLVGHARVLKKGVAPASGSLLERLWPAVRDAYASVAVDIGAETDSQAADTWMLPVLRRFSPSWSPVLPSPVPGTGSAQLRRIPVEFYWVGASARYAGTAVHRWLQLAGDGQVHIGEESLPALRTRTAHWLRDMGLAANRIEPIVERVEDALRGIVTDERGRWLLTGEGHTELALSGLIDGAVESVVIDRVRVDAEGSHWIVDYKTSSHEGGDLTAFLESEVERYRDQLARYAELYRNYCDASVRCALYFPLLQQFVEVDIRNGG